MLDERFVFAGIVFNIIGGASYLIDTIKGKAKPNKVTWFLWALAPLIAFIAEIQKGVGLQSLMTFMVGFNPLLIFLASFVNKKAYWKLSRLDIACGLFSVGGLLLWYVTREGNIAIFFSILSDGLAGVPTIIKSYFAPQTENGKIFLFGGVSALITLFTIDIWNFEHYGFPFYILAICTILYILIRFRIGKKMKIWIK